MKTQQIYIGINGTGLAMSSGRKMVAALPPKKGDKYFRLLLDDGTMSRMNGVRIQGVGVARFLSENGYEPAQPGNEFAAQLADLIDIAEATTLVEDAMQARAGEFHEKYAGQNCIFIPFDAARSIYQGIVDGDSRFRTTSLGIQSGLSTAVLNIEHDSTVVNRPSFDFGNGWVLAPDEGPSMYPRCSEYGGPVELACYIICNSGLGVLEGSHRLEMSTDDDVDPNYCRGSIGIRLTDGDLVQVGIDAGDELYVAYIRDGKEIYSRSRLFDLKIGPVIGAIAAVLIRVKEMDAAPLDKKGKKKLA